MRTISSALSDIGRKRQSNEDAFLVDESLGLYVVADGMGGHAAGEVASQETVETVHGMVLRERQKLTAFTGYPPPMKEIKPILRLLESAVQAATYHVFGMAEHMPEHTGMGTTVSALLLAGKCAFTAQVGDSRVYQVRDGRARQITEDHTLVAWQVKEGLLSADEAERSPHKNIITRAVGSHDYVQVDTSIVDVRVGDAFMVCSDGLHEYLATEELPSIVALGPKVATERLIDLACNRGGKDNITAIVVQINDC